MFMSEQANLDPVWK